MKRIKYILILFLFVTTIYAQPGQPETSSFTPIGTDLVNLSTGDFTYNIPLMEVGGYPINISYQSGITMEQEASMVGLGWNINVGAITRSMRGIPDDFKGDVIETTTSFKDNWTLGVNLGPDLEIFGFKPVISPKFDPSNKTSSKKKNQYESSLSLSLGVYYNSYTGYGFEWVFSPSITASKTRLEDDFNTLGMSLSKRTEDIGSSLQATVKTKGKKFGSLNIGTMINTVDGLKYATFHNNNKLFNILSDAAISSIINTKSYTPSLPYRFKSYSYTYNTKIGLENFGAFTSIKTSIYHSKSKLKNTVSNVNSFGYLHLEQAKNSDLLDLNREMDNGYIEGKPNLGVPSLMHDIFSISGHGVSGTFRAYRNDVGVLYDPQNNQNSMKAGLGTEFGAGLPTNVKAAVNPSFNINSIKAQKWSHGNFMVSKFDFVSNTIDSLYESVYFKNIGEKTIMSDKLYNDLGGANAVKIDLFGPEYTSNTISWNQDNSNFKKGSFNIKYNSERAKRGQVFSYLTASESSKLNEKLEYVDQGYWINNMNIIEESRIDNYRKPHHISHCEVTNTDGMRYFYSLPVYNKKYQEVSFSVCNDDVNENGLVIYDNKENSIDNESGKDWFYERKNIPAYAHSYLLTGVLSPDYVDLTGDGITDDDLGQAVKFHYFKSSDNYKWRFPYNEMQANFNGGFDSKDYDNRGNYLYGEKELVYIQSIESKTQVAVFKYEDRYDAYEVKGENGGLGSQSMKKLIEVSLYAKKDLIQNLDNAIPIKTVFFNYDYSLLQGVPSNNYDIDGQLGRLTLKDIYFTYRDSPKSKSEKYQFAYNNDYSYSRRDIDRWGSFKPNSSNTTNLNNTDFPYVVQSQSLNDQVKKDKDYYQEQWNLKSIKTPTKGEIKIIYESDDYAYVQDKEAMRMTLLSGVEKLDDNKLYDNNKNPSNILLFKVPKGASSASDHLKDSILYLRAYVKLFGSNYEYVPVYLNVIDKKLISNNSAYDILQLTIKNEKTKDKVGKDINPITKTSIQFAKLHLNELLTFSKTNDCKQEEDFDEDGDQQQIIEELLSFAAANTVLIGNYYNQRMSLNHAKFIDLDKSYARLNDPFNMKLGGGSRVKSIESHDNWGDFTDGTGLSTFYATDYFYTTNHEGKEISSGVTSYEPSIGGDENPFKKPVSYSLKKFWAPDDKYVVEEPVGEIHFPSAQIVYSEVTQKVRRNSISRKYASGKTVNKFYTTKDFPVQVKQTSLEKEQTPWLYSNLGKMHPFLKSSIDNIAVSQGYSIVKNDMHGKPKSTFVYAEGQKMPISGVEYIYKTDDKGNLNNLFDVVKQDGSIYKTTVGLDYEMYVDMRETRTSHKGLETSFNLDATGVFPVFTAVPVLVLESTSFKSSVFQKIVFQYGLIDSIKVFDNSSEIATKNIALDAENSGVLISKTFNEFGDPIYNTSYPAHWVYKAMGGSYQNIGAELRLTTNSDGKIVSNFNLSAGDELLIKQTGNNYSINNNKVWVYPFQGEYYLIDIDGKLVKSLSSTIAKVIRPSYRNMNNLSVSQFKSIDFPNIKGNFSNNNILDASAIEYSDDWRFLRKTRIEGDICYPIKNDIVNPFQVGIKGNWRTFKNYLYLSNRKVSKNSIRRGGLYESFVPFWQFSSNQLIKSNDLNWKWTSESVEIHPNGSQLSTKDPLGRYSSFLFGYDNQLKIASVSNSEINNSLNLNFESIDLDCDESTIYRHLSAHINNDISHTGNSSLCLDGINSSMIIDQSLNQISNVSSTIPSYKLQDKDLLPEFKPDTGVYLVSVWVREDHNDYVHKYSNATLDVATTTQNFSFLPEGPMVEGWQKIEGEFTISTNDLMIDIIFNKHQFTSKVFFDDFRIHPIDANMMAHVYDKKDYHLMAELDENNYAVFYEYDEEGKIIRVKKETEKGIVTIEEKRSHIHQKEKSKKFLND